MAVALLNHPAPVSIHAQQQHAASMARDRMHVPMSIALARLTFGFVRGHVQTVAALAWLLLRGHRSRNVKEEWW